MSDENTQILLAGDVYISRLDGAGNPLGLIGPLNTDQLQIKQEVEEKVQTSQMRDTFGQTRASVNLPKPAVVSIGFQDQPSELLAMALLGDTSALSESAATVTDEPVTAVLGKWVKLPNRNITAASVVVTDTVPNPAFTEGTDYEINYRLGMIRALAGGAITDGMSLLVDYDSGAVAGTRIAGGSESQISARILLDGKNLVNGQSVHLEIHQSTLRPDGDIDLNSSEFITTTLTGNMITPAGKSSPFVLDELT